MAWILDQSGGIDRGAAISYDETHALEIASTGSVSLVVRSPSNGCEVAILKAGTI
jgi:hypothetical protein